MNQEPQIVLVFSPDTINLVLSGLHELPHGRVRGLFDHIRAQAQQQIDAHAEALRRPPPAEPSEPAAAAGPAAE